MSRRITISLPDDLAAQLDGQANVSAYIADLLRLRGDRERHDEAMRAVGLDPEQLRTPEAKARVRATLYVTPQVKAGRRELYERLMAGRGDGLGPARTDEDVS